MTRTPLPRLLRVNAVVYLLLGVLLAASSWNDLYDTLELPRPEPALFAQIGGMGFVGGAYVAWTSAVATDFRAARTTAATNLLAALVIAVWLLFRDVDRWGVDALGYALLVGLAAALVALGIAEAILARRKVTRVVG